MRERAGQLAGREGVVEGQGPGAGSHVQMELVGAPSHLGGRSLPPPLPSSRVLVGSAPFKSLWEALRYHYRRQGLGVAHLKQLGYCLRLELVLKVQEDLTALKSGEVVQPQRPYAEVRRLEHSGAEGEGKHVHTETSRGVLIGVDSGTTAPPPYPGLSALYLPVAMLICL